jgi:hypothetical protein
LTKRHLVRADAFAELFASFCSAPEENSGQALQGFLRGGGGYLNPRRPLETLGGAPRNKFGAGCWCVAQNDNYPAPHFINFQFAALKTLESLCPKN